MTGTNKDKAKTKHKAAAQNADWQKHCATSGSHVIPQRSTGEAQPSLTSVIGREPVLYRWYERSMPSEWLCNICTPARKQRLPLVN